MSVTAYTETDTITITCSNYNNPVYRRVTQGFQLEITDNEAIGKLVFKSNTWSFDKTGEDDLISLEVAEDAFSFSFYLDKSATAETGQVFIQ